jgi:hypothetical protein
MTYSEQMKERTRMLAVIVFSGDDPEGPPDVEGAAAALWQAGYQVHRLPDRVRRSLDHPLDDFIEAEIVFDGPDDDATTNRFCDEVKGLVHKYGGEIAEWGPIRKDEDYAPFASWWPEASDRQPLPH